ncbi:MAG: uracil-DNA glycosylase [Candidatus Andersenbacteria bacterium]|nr:uracil-DNA glycosylase [Candidatus Andersenbacteria bacterium]
MTLGELNNQILKCEKCALCKTRTNVVPGKGSSKAEIMFIGEGPGKKEDEQGIPFIGAAGKLLDKLLALIDLKREDIYIANVVKCRPPENRDPLPEEVEACRPWLDQQIEIIKPKLIVLLGRHSMDRFLPNQKISIDHGKPKRRNGQVYYPIYHPAAALYRNGLLEDLEKDFERIPKVLKIIKESEIKKEEKIEQVDLGI